MMDIIDINELLSVSKSAEFEELKKMQDEESAKRIRLSDEIISLARQNTSDKRLTVKELIRFLVRGKYIFPNISVDTMQEMILQLEGNGYLPGIIFENETLYAKEEHYAYKRRVQQDVKKQIAAKAVNLLSSGQKILLDAGSTTYAIAEAIGNRFLSKELHNLTVITNSVENAHALLQVSNKLGWDEDNDYLDLYLVGGRVRINTIACVSGRHTDPDHAVRAINEICERMNGVDIAFVGTNGIRKEVGFTTTKECEKLTKSAMLSNASSKYVVTDASKFGLEQRRVFAGFNEEICVITNNDIQNRQILREYEDYFKEKQTTIEFTEI